MRGPIGEAEGSRTSSQARRVTIGGALSQTPLALRGPVGEPTPATRYRLQGRTS